MPPPPSRSSIRYGPSARPSRISRATPSPPPFADLPMAVRVHRMPRRRQATEIGLDLESGAQAEPDQFVVVLLAGNRDCLDRRNQLSLVQVGRKLLVQQDHVAFLVHRELAAIQDPVELQQPTVHRR